MAFITLDFETFFDSKDKYSLKVMTYEQYIRDERFRVTGVGVKIDREPTVWITGEAVELYLKTLFHPGNNHTLLCHNAMFDGAILSWYYGLAAANYYCTQAISRALWNHYPSSLAKLAERCFPNNPKMRKGKELVTVDGVRFYDDAQEEAIAKYCIQDVDLTFACFAAVLPRFPKQELDLLDLTLKMFIHPTFVLDTPRVEKYLKELEEERYRVIMEAAEKEDLLRILEVYAEDFHEWSEEFCSDKPFPPSYLRQNFAGFAKWQLGWEPLKLPKVVLDPQTAAEKNALRKAQLYTALLHSDCPPLIYAVAYGIIKKHDSDFDKAKAVFASSSAFAAYIINEHGCEVKLKDSPTPANPDNRALCTAKNDLEFLDLQKERQDLKHLWDARITASSTIEVSRAKTLLDHGQISHINPDGKLAAPLNFAAAHTGRWGGTNKCLPPEAEVLTPGGWVSITEANKHPILQANEQLQLSWVQATLNEFDYEGELVCVKHGTVQGDFTPDHRVAFLHKHKHDVISYIKPAAHLLSPTFSGYTPTAGILQSTTSTLTPAQCRILVMVQADGNFNCGVTTIGVKKERKKQRAKLILEEAQVSFSSSINTKGYEIFTIHKEDTAWIAGILNKENIKCFGPWVLSLSADSIKALVDETQHWDAHKRDKSWIYFSVVPDNVDWLATAAHLCGYTASVRYNRPNNGGKTRLSMLNIKPRAYAYLESKNISKRFYKGKVYCPTVPTGYFLYRYNNQIGITGNCNFQNFKRGSELRKSLKAPKGYKVVVADLSNIEGRMLAWFARQPELLEAFKNGDDIYSDFASTIFNRKVDRKRVEIDPETGKEYKPDETEGFVGKVCVLGLGYGMGAKTLQTTFAKGAMGGPQLFFDDPFCKNIVATYRNVNYMISGTWSLAQHAIEAMTDPHMEPYDWNGVRVEYRRIRLPNGLHLNYPRLERYEQEDDHGNLRVRYRYWNGDFWKDIYGGLLTENIIQALARIVMGEMMLAIEALLTKKQWGRVALTVHDEIVAIVKEDYADTAFKGMLSIMSTPPEWCNDGLLTLAAEGGIDDCYSK